MIKILVLSITVILFCSSCSYNHLESFLLTQEESQQEEVVDLQVFKEKIKDLVHWFDADLSNIEGKVDHYISGNDQEYIDDLMDAIKDGIDRLKQRVNGIREQ